LPYRIFQILPQSLDLFYLASCSSNEACKRFINAALEILPVLLAIWCSYQRRRDGYPHVINSIMQEQETYPN